MTPEQAEPIINSGSNPVLRILLIAAVAVAAHLAVMGVRRFTRWLLTSQLGSLAKAQTVTAFIASVLVFVVYFIAAGFALREAGVPLGTYLASATIIGLAVSFGSQSLVQDVISGLTLIFGNLINVGDMVDVAGQVGVVERIGIRYTVIVNFHGAWVYIPNRNVVNVINYSSGYARAFLDCRVREPSHLDEAESRLRRVCDEAYRQFSGLIMLPPRIRRIAPTDAQTRPAMPHAETPTDPPGPYLRVRFPVWPGQGGIVETTVRQAVLQAMRELDPQFPDWMVTVHYRAEPDDPARRLPRPAAVRRRAAAARREKRGPR